jgi:DNA-binding MarR family transcriptional regulator
LRKNTLGSLIWLRIARFTHQSNLLSNDFLKQFGITTAQFDVLNQVSIYQPITQSQLAAKVTVSEGGISRMLARLEQEGYIQRKQDWKTKWITLTPRGESKMHEVFEHQLTFQTSILNECLTEGEQKTLYKLMTKLQKHSENKLGN